MNNSHAPHLAKDKFRMTSGHLPHSTESMVPKMEEPPNGMVAAEILASIKDAAEPRSDL